jgi:hypothetical protein
MGRTFPRSEVCKDLGPRYNWQGNHAPTVCANRVDELEAVNIVTARTATGIRHAHHGGTRKTRINMSKPGKPEKEFIVCFHLVSQKYSAQGDYDDRCPT